jgi:hypothetical protein
MDLEETEVRNNCAGEGQQQLNRPTDPQTELSQLGVAVVISENLVVEAWKISETQRKGNVHRWKPLPSNG